METKDLARRLLDELAAGFPLEADALLHPDARLRAWRYDGASTHRPRKRVATALRAVASGWHDPHLEVFSLLAEGNRASADCRVTADINGRTMAMNLSLHLLAEDGLAFEVDLYVAQPLRFGRLHRIVRADLAPAEEQKFLAEYGFTIDRRKWVPSEQDNVRTAGYTYSGSGLQHPGTNSVFAADWDDGEADARIEAILEEHRRLGIGLQWFVAPWDRPADLRDRLERHGLMLAGDQTLMVRNGLDDLDDIPVNPDVTVEDLRQADDATIEAALQVVGTAFKWPPEQMDNERAGWFDDARKQSDDRMYVARLDGKVVANANLYFRAGTAYLGGAATLPEFRARKIYSTLLRRRLEDARAAGYEMAVIHSEPMSRRVVSKFGFETRATFYVYGWMPEMDPEVIRTLVADD